MVHMIKHPLLLAALAAVALALGACGSSGKDDNNSASARDDKAFEGALKFAKCLREHGIDAPDPQRGANGGITQRMGRGKGPDAIDQGKMETAQKACEHLMDVGGGEAPDPAEQARQRDAFLAYARCMRAQGIDMPDPKFEGSKVMMRVGGPGSAHGPDPDSAVFKAADRTCHAKLAEVEKGAKR